MQEVLRTLRDERGDSGVVAAETRLAHVGVRHCGGVAVVISAHKYTFDWCLLVVNVVIIL